MIRKTIENPSNFSLAASYLLHFRVPVKNMNIVNTYSYMLTCMLRGCTVAARRLWMTEVCQGHANEMQITLLYLPICYTKQLIHVGSWVSD